MIVQNISVEMMSFLVQSLTLLLIAVYSASVINHRKAFKFGCYMMFLVNIIGQVIIAGGGPGACIGIVILPLWGGGVGCGVVGLIKLLQKA